MDPDFLIPIAGMITGGTVVVALSMTIRHWVDRHYDHKRSLQAGASDSQVAQLDDRVAMLEEQVATRMMDLEERMDFTERVLTRGSDEPAERDDRR
jgi:hypothetical protein